MELSVNVHSTDVFLFPSKGQRRRSSTIDSESSAPSSSSSRSSTSSRRLSTASSTLSPYDGQAPAYSEVDDVTVFSSKGSNDEQAVLYAYVDIHIPLSSSAPSASRPVRNRLKSLTLSLVSHETISFPRGGLEAHQTHMDEKIIQEALEIESFQPGRTYRFERAFLIDHTAAPFQRSSWGVNKQMVVAKATFNGFLSRPMTAQKKVYFVDCQNEEGNEMITWDKDVRTHADGIGPFSLRNRSDVFTVGGYLKTSFDMLSPMENVTIVAIRASVEQRATLSSRKHRPSYKETLSPKKVRFLELNRGQVEELFKAGKLAGGGEGIGIDGECYPSLEIVSRLPDDNKIRPSTVEGNDAMVRIKNYIDYEIDFIDGDFAKNSKENEEMIYIDGQKMKRFHVSIPVFLNSCACRPASLNLPSYACEDPLPACSLQRKQAETTAPAQSKQADPSASPCICTFTLESLREVEKESYSSSYSRGCAEDFDPLPSYDKSELM